MSAHRESARPGVRRAIALAALLVAASVVLAACAAGPYPPDAVDTAADPPGFWLGLWHGLIVPITFVVSLFTDTVNIYAVPNNGNWYNFGFVLGIMLVFSGPANQATPAGRGRQRTVEP